MGAFVDTSELRALAVQLGAVPAAMLPRASAAVRRTGFAVVAEAQVQAPVDTGTLASSISIDVDADGLGFTAGPEVEYGQYVEYGTSGPYVIPNAFGRGDYVLHPGISPQPFMGPAFDGKIDDAEAAIGRAGYEALA